VSGECDYCGEHTLDCSCHFREYHNHVNTCEYSADDKKRFSLLSTKTIPLSHKIDPPATKLHVKWINVRGRKEHEALIKDSVRCNEIGFDQMYEIMVYLKRWGSWLSDN
jgi:hypothetical protein